MRAVQLAHHIGKLGLASGTGRLLSGGLPRAVDVQWLGQPGLANTADCQSHNKMGVRDLCLCCCQLMLDRPALGHRSGQCGIWRQHGQQRMQTTDTDWTGSKRCDAQIHVVVARYVCLSSAPPFGEKSGDCNASPRPTPYRFTICVSPAIVGLRSRKSVARSPNSTSSAAPMLPDIILTMKLSGSSGGSSKVSPL